VRAFRAGAFHVRQTIIRDCNALQLAVQFSQKAEQAIIISAITIYLIVAVLGWQRHAKHKDSALGSELRNAHLLVALCASQQFPRKCDPTTSKRTFSNDQVEASFASSFTSTVLAQDHCYSDSSCIHVKNQSSKAKLRMSRFCTAMECAGACSQLDEYVHCSCLKLCLQANLLCHSCHGCLVNSGRGIVRHNPCTPSSIQPAWVGLVLGQDFKSWGMGTCRSSILPRWRMENTSSN
jgi:hypothetical protein